MNSSLQHPVSLPARPTASQQIVLVRQHVKFTSTALIAQLVERVTSNDEVAGSTPS
jgi:hypothetical protein